MSDSVLPNARRVLQIESEAIAQLSARLEPDSPAARAFEAAVETILNCSGHVVVTGLGKTGAIGRKIASTLASTGTPALFVHATEALHGDLGMLTSGDVLLAISYSGRSDELLSLLPAVRAQGIPVVALTGNPSSYLGLHADIVVETRVEREACPLNLAPTASTSAALALGDALAVCVMQARGFSERDFVKFHPGGTLGRGATLQVADLMRVGDRVAICTQTNTVRVALEAITQASAGAALVVNDEGLLCGYLSDGDVRREILRAPDARALLMSPVDELMTRSPLALRASMPALEALRLLQERNFDHAPVVDESEKPAGWLDAHELLKAGLM